MDLTRAPAARAALDASYRRPGGPRPRSDPSPVEVTHSLGIGLREDAYLMLDTMRAESGRSKNELIEAGVRLLWALTHE